MSAVTDQPALAGVFTRAASSTAGTWDDDKRTVEVIVSSGAPVARYSWAEGNFTEVLTISPEAIDLSRADGMAVLDSHSPYSMETRLGTVVAGSMRVAGGSLVATVKLSRNALGESLAQDLRDGHPFSISVGYRIDAYEWDEGTTDAIPTLTAIRWTPMEISAVCIPADPAARTRNFEGNDMSTTNDTRGRAAPGLDPATANERRRVTELRSIAALARADVSEETLTRAIDTGVAVDAFRAQVLERMVARQEAAETFPHAAPRGGANERTAEFASRLVEVLAGRAANGGEIAREFLEAGGVRSSGMSDREIGRVLMGGNRSIWNGGTRAMHTSGDFSLLVSKAAANVLLERFSASPSVLKRFSRLRNAVDFRDVRFYRPGEAPSLVRVNEHGEIKSGTMSEESNGFRIETFGRMFALTFQASVNDGLGAFSDFLATFAESAIRLEGDLFAQLLDGNGPRLDDGRPLFDVGHGNLAETGSALSIESLDAAVIAMRVQKNVNGSGLAGTTPAAIVVGPALELKAKQLVASVQATDRAEINPHALEVVVEDRLGRDFRGWFVLANPASRPAFIHGGLDGHQSPEVESKEGWDVLGTEFRCIHFFGAGVHDYRAAYKNPGV